MSKLLDFVLKLLVVVGLFILIFKQKPSVTSTEYTPRDTVITNVSFTMPKQQGPTIQPYTVKVYPSVTIPSTSVVVNDSLIKVIDSLKNQVEVLSINFLKRFPDKPKLITGSFSRDTITLSLLRTDGNLYEDSYPVNFSKYTYQYGDKGLTKRRNKFKWKDLLTTNVYGGLGYSIQNSEFLYLKTNYDISSFNTSVRIAKPLTKDYFDIEGTIGIKLK